MFRQNLHAHSNYDDGRSTIREMIEASMAEGLESVGISVHSPLPYDSGWGVYPDRLDEYVAEMHALTREYAGRIDVFTGIEWDILTDTDLSRFEYVIGSVHHMPFGDPAPCVDHCAQTTKEIIAYYGGDVNAAAEAYFAQYDAVAAQPEVDIVGHIDLLTKFDEQAGFFTGKSKRYTSAALCAMEKLVRAGKIFEINTGAISRGYRTTPYPDRALLHALREMGGKVTISADAHHASGVACAFDQAEALAKACGFTSAQVLRRTEDGVRFVDTPFED